jgi:hypothetical protein
VQARAEGYARVCCCQGRGAGGGKRGKPSLTLSRKLLHTPKFSRVTDTLQRLGLASFFPAFGGRAQGWATQPTFRWKRKEGQARVRRRGLPCACIRRRRWRRRRYQSDLQPEKTATPA